MYFLSSFQLGRLWCEDEWNKRITFFYVWSAYHIRTEVDGETRRSHHKRKGKYGYCVKINSNTIAFTIIIWRLLNTSLDTEKLETF